MARVFADLPEACRNTLAVAERCNLTLDFDAFHLPRYVVPSEHTLDSYLHELAHEGLRRRYGATPGDAAEARLAPEPPTRGRPWPCPDATARRRAAPPRRDWPRSSPSSRRWGSRATSWSSGTSSA